MTHEHGPIIWIFMVPRRSYGKTMFLKYSEIDRIINKNKINFQSIIIYSTHDTRISFRFYDVNNSVYLCFHKLDIYTANLKSRNELLANGQYESRPTQCLTRSRSSLNLGLDWVKQKYISHYAIADLLDITANTIC